MYEVGSFNQNGEYSQFTEISRGGMGIVYRAIDQENQRPVAIKVIQGQQFDLSDLQRFQREAQALIQLKHPHILHLHRLLFYQEQAVLVLEYVDGHDIAALHKLGQIQRNHGGDVQRVSQWFEDIAKGLQYCHDAGMIHRDVKPHNILIEEGTDRAVIIDFGLVKKNIRHAEAPSGFSLSLTAEDEVLGTPSFMSPELFTGASATPASDVWAFGATLYFALSGMAPFSGRSPVQVYRRILEGPPDSLHSFNSKVPDWLEEICLKCMSEDPLDRPHFKTIIEHFQLKKAERAGRPASTLLLWTLGALIALVSLISAGMILLTPEHEALVLPTPKKAKKARATSTPPAKTAELRYDLGYFLKVVSDPASLTKIPDRSYSVRRELGVIKARKAEIQLKRTLCEIEGAGCLTRIFLSQRAPKGKLSLFLDRSPQPTLEIDLEDLARAGYRDFPSPWFELQKDQVVIHLPIPFRERCELLYTGESGLGSFVYNVDYRKYFETPIVTLTKGALKAHSKTLYQLATKIKASPSSPENVRSFRIRKKQDTTIFDGRSGSEEGGRLLTHWGLRFLFNDSLQKNPYSLILVMEIDGEERVRVPLLSYFMVNLADRIDPFKFKIRSRFIQVKHRNDWLLSRWPIAFRDRLKIRIENRSNIDFNMDFQQSSEASPWTSKSLYFTTHWKRQDRLFAGTDFQFKIKRNQGYFVGHYLTVHNPVNLWWSFGPYHIRSDSQRLGLPESLALAFPFQELYFGPVSPEAPYKTLRDLHDRRNSYQSRHSLWNGSPVFDNRGRNSSTYYRWRELDRVYFQRAFSMNFFAVHEMNQALQGRAMISFFYLKRLGPSNDPIGPTQPPAIQGLCPGIRLRPGEQLVEGEDMHALEPRAKNPPKRRTFFETPNREPFGEVLGFGNWKAFGCLYWRFQHGDFEKRVSFYAPIKAGRYRVQFRGFRTGKSPLRLSINDQVISGEKWLSLEPNARSFSEQYWGEFQFDKQVKISLELRGDNPESEEFFLDYLHFIPSSKNR